MTTGRGKDDASHLPNRPIKNVLGLMAERKRAEAAGTKPVAKAINISYILAVSPDHKVVLFFTGHVYAGRVGANRLAKVLAHRARELAPPMQMCCALAANIAPEFATVVGNCLTHGRRGVVEVLEHFPEAARHVIEVLAKLIVANQRARCAVPPR